MTAPGLIVRSGVLKPGEATDTSIRDVAKKSRNGRSSALFVRWRMASVRSIERYMSGFVRPWWSLLNVKEIA